MLPAKYLPKAATPVATTEITKQTKVFFTDTGLLQICGQLSSGSIFEDAIASQLCQIGEVNYYEKSSGTEIDFILDKKTAIEAKETPSDFDFKTLQRRAAPLGITHCLLIGRNPSAAAYHDFIWGGNVV